MATFSVAEAKNNLPKLIDRALDGEEVVITRHGKPVVELRPAAPIVAPNIGREDIEAWRIARRRARPGLGTTSVKLLNEMYEEAEREQDERLFGRERPASKSD
ncbi:MAG TPA: type II toxin-antitoxin system prevent-host-death family antitoxin [Stellaceae bacterium]